MVNWRSLKGGQKDLALRTHRAEILAYFEAHGEVATREWYNIRKNETWQHFLSPREVRHKMLTKADKAIIRSEIAEEGLREVKREVRDLKEQYGKFVPYLADEITRKFFVPLLSGKVELPKELEYKPAPDQLSLADFEGKLEK